MHFKKMKNFQIFNLACEPSSASELPRTQAQPLGMLYLQISATYLLPLTSRDS
jgi:hypothetical protein